MPKFSNNEINELYEEETNFEGLDNYDENIDEDYYDTIPEDDRDGKYYEDFYSPVIEDIYSNEHIYNNSEYLSEENFEEYYGRILSTPDKKISDNKNDSAIKESIELLKQAKQHRIAKNFDKAISLCDKILDKNPVECIYPFTINLKIASLGDKLSLEAYTLAEKFMPQMENKKDFINTMFGLLAKPINYPTSFIQKLAYFYPFVLEEYIYNLGDNNPKRDRLLKCLNTNRKTQIHEENTTSYDENIPF